MDAAVLSATKSVHRIDRQFHLPVLLCRFSLKRSRYWIGMAAAMILARLALLPLLPLPEPMHHDEFSYLLSADTFVHGRLANPALPLPNFFESPHILVRPIYASKYPPGQGLVLALGRKILGHPYWGVVLSGAVLIVLLCWAANAWLPPQWTLVAGGLAWILFFVRHYWFTSYWGGNVAACGGALVVGGLGYLLRGKFSNARYSLAVGAATLFATRPYEGGVLCLGVLVICALHFWKLSGGGKRAMLNSVVLPNAALLLVAASLAGWYNLRTTGHVSQMPYFLHVRQYDAIPVLWILPPYGPKQYGNTNLRRQHEWEAAAYQRVRRFPLYLALSMQLAFFLIGAVWQQFLTFGLLLLGVPWARMRGRKKWLVVLFAMGTAALIPELFAYAHYTAPFTPVILILIVAGMRALWYRMAALCLRGPVFALALAILATPLFLDYLNAFQTPRTTPRAQLIRQLTTQGGRHIVLVDYAETWIPWAPNGEWVYNGADLESSAVIFAHLRTDSENRELMHQYSGRMAWVARVGPQPDDVRLAPYSPASAPAEP
jgi:hypothetical protein